MRSDNALFKHVDSGTQESEYVTEKWLEEISKPLYLKPSATLWSDLEKKY